jgi:hypothetical protein
MIRRQYRRSITLDPLRYEYDGNVFNDMESVFDYAIENNLDDADQDFKITLRLNDETIKSEVSACFQLAERLGNLLMVVEESSIYFDRYHPTPSFRRLVSQGRHFNVSLLCVSQRVPELDTTFRAQANTLVTFLQTSPTDLEGLQRWGFDPDEVKLLEKYDRRYSLPIAGVNYLFDGEPLSAYGIRSIEQKQTGNDDETTNANDLSQRQES